MNGFRALQQLDDNVGHKESGQLWKVSASVKQESKWKSTIAYNFLLLLNFTMWQAEDAIPDRNMCFSIPQARNYLEQLVNGTAKRREKTNEIEPTFPVI